MPSPGCSTGHSAPMSSARPGRRACSAARRQDPRIAAGNLVGVAQRALAAAVRRTGLSAGPRRRWRFPTATADSCSPGQTGPPSPSRSTPSGRYGCGATSRPEVCTGVPSTVIISRGRTSPSASSCSSSGDSLTATLLAGASASIMAAALTGSPAPSPAPSPTHGDTAVKVPRLAVHAELRVRPHEPDDAGPRQGGQLFSPQRRRPACQALPRTTRTSRGARPPRTHR